MHARKTFVMALTVLMMLATLPLAALAEVPARDGVADGVTDVVADPITDVAADPVADRERDRIVDRERDRELDRCRDRISDRVTDCVDRPERPIDRCRLHRGDDHPRHCVEDHRPHDVNVRELIYRLFKAHEWEKLFQLLHRLGLV